MTPDTVKSCCAAAYDSELARALLGDSFHPGGLALTRRLGDLLGLKAGMRVLDVACGKGESARFLAEQFECEVCGIDLGCAEKTGIGPVSLGRGDAEHILFEDRSFDAVICECAFCTFPDKTAAAGEFARVLRPGGRVGISDLTRNGPLPAELDGLLAWIACIADARPVSEYAAYLAGAGFQAIRLEAHDEALLAMAREIQGRLLGLELMSGLKKIDLAGTDLSQARQFARAAMEAIRGGLLGYALIIAEAPR